MMSARKKLLAVAAAVAMWAAFQPDTVSAQTSGIDYAASTVFRWVGQDQNGQYDMLSLWKVDNNLNFVTSQQYGPYPGYVPTTITTAGNGNTYVLWLDQTQGYPWGAVLWLVDPNLNYVTAQEYGPYQGLTPQGLSVDTNGFNSFRLIWHNDNDGSVDVWVLDQNLNWVNNQVYGPVSGWESGWYVH
jgi:hypothetical protein